MQIGANSPSIVNPTACHKSFGPGNFPARPATTPRKRPRKQPSPVLVFFPKHIDTYPSLSDCAKALNMTKASISNHISKGTADRQGRFYDYALPLATENANA